MREHSILEPGHTATFSGPIMGNVACVEAVKAAALIFTFHGLRDIAIIAVFFDSLGRRLRDGLCGIFDYPCQNTNPACIPDEFIAAPSLLRLCVNEWKASAIKTG